MTDTKPKKRGVHWLVWSLPALLLIVAPMANHFFLWHLFRAPSGSMQPTISPGDWFAASKWSYGYGRYSFAPFDSPFGEDRRVLAHPPSLGEIAVFRPAPEPDRSFVKRIVGLPGDRIQMIAGVLHINGVAVALEPAGEVAIADPYGGSPDSIPAFRETLPNGVSYIVLDRAANSELDNTSVTVVPPGHVFMLGDDRDNSADSRVPSMMGTVPINNLIGRVDHVF